MKRPTGVYVTARESLHAEREKVDRAIDALTDLIGDAEERRRQEIDLTEHRKIVRERDEKIRFLEKQIEKQNSELDSSRSGESQPEGGQSLARTENSAADPVDPPEKNPKVRAASSVEEKCPVCGALKSDFTTPQAFGAHKRFCKKEHRERHSTVASQGAMAKNQKEGTRRIEIAVRSKCPVCGDQVMMLRMGPDEEWTCPNCESDVAAELEVAELRRPTDAQKKLLDMDLAG